MAEKCKECGCKCSHCTQNEQQQGDMHLHVEIENLRQRLLERDNHIVTMETQFLNEADKFPNGELASMKEELVIWEEKYTRLHEAHKRVQKVNQNLEDKLLKIVDKCETEKSAFTKDIATLSHRLADANFTIHRLTQDNEKYRNDINLAIQLLQCKPSNFVGQKYDSLPSEVQAKVRTYVAQKRHSSDVIPPDVKSITVPISTFPPTAMVYNVTKPNVEKHSDDDSDEPKPPIDVSAAIMAKVLEDREKERIFAKHCDTCTCHRSILMVDAITQTAVEDIVSCNDCRMKYFQTNENNPDSRKSNEKSTQGKENQNSMTHAIYQEVNENAANYGKVQLHNNTHCTKNTSFQHLSARDKFVARNGRVLENSKEDGRVNITIKSSLNKKNSMRRNDPQLQCVFQSQNESINKQPPSQKVGDPNSRVNSDKTKQTGFNKRCDSQIDTKSNTNHWNNLEKKSNSNQPVVENSKSNIGGLEQSHIDIINDRLWKNEWTKLKSQVNPKDGRNVDKISSDVEIDIINDRTWRNDGSGQQTQQPTQLTLIEVKNIDNIANQNDSGQVEVATSPSFSSDSMVISTSDPSSSSSDVVQSTTGTQLSHNVSNTKPSSQNRITGPRNCLVRVTPGSKNILLDNVGHYKTVLYTSGNSKPNTALVHTKKSSRSGSERSISTSSEENSPVLLHDNNQLQRVAEWVQSSVHMESTVSSGYKLKSNEKIMDETSALVYVNDSQSKNKSLDNDKRLLGNIPENNCSVIDMKDYNHKGLRNEMNSVSLSSHISHVIEEKDKDLITFDVPNENEKLPKNNKEVTDFDYEVKITKEMEETYLKLAASLDPVALSLSGTDSADLTIEKYRKDYKKLCVQKGHDKAGSKT